jgi:catechol 2,3-dioxygenase-like lactoylglutathione lyase family enzyme
MSISKSTIAVVLSVSMLLGAAPAFAQLPAPNSAGVSMGHTHFTVPNPAKHLALWETLGGKRGASGPLNYVAFPGMYLLFTEGTAEVPSIQTSANHIGFSVKDYAAYRAKLLEAGATFFFESEENGQILADLPDGIRIEILTDKEQAEPIIFHHIHLATTDTMALRDWYLQVFGAEAGERRGLPSALVPGGRVDVMGAGANGPAPRGSKGGALDHIGFEVADMDAFAKHLESLGIKFDSEPRRIDAIGLTIAFLTDPVGTYIEVTEGLAALK